MYKYINFIIFILIIIIFIVGNNELTKCNLQIGIEYFVNKSTSTSTSKSKYKIPNIDIQNDIDIDIDINLIGSKPEDNVKYQVENHNNSSNEEKNLQLNRNIIEYNH